MNIYELGDTIKYLECITLIRKVMDISFDFHFKNPTFNYMKAFFLILKLMESVKYFRQVKDYRLSASICL